MGDFQRLPQSPGSYTGSCVSKLLSEDPGDIVSPLESVLGHEIMSNLYSRRRKQDHKEEDSLDILLFVGLKGRKRGPEVPSSSSFKDQNEMHSFNRSTKGSYRGLRLETRKQVIFKMRKTATYSVLREGRVMKDLSAFEALEMMMSTPLTAEKISDRYKSYLEGSRVKFYSSEMQRKPPFRTFTALKVPMPYKELRKVDLVWSDKMVNYKPPNVSDETLASLRRMTHEEKLKALESYERLNQQELVVHHNCGEPKQGFKYSLTANMGFVPVCSHSNNDPDLKMIVSSQVWGGLSLCDISDDATYRDVNGNGRIKMCQVNERGIHVYRSKKNKFESSSGMKFVKISKTCELYRALDDEGTVVYKLEKPDWSDINPNDFGVEIPNSTWTSGLVSTTVQAYNYDNYSRCSNRTSQLISESLGVEIRDWTQAGTYMKHDDQVEFKVSKDHFLTHIPPDMNVTGLISVVRSADSKDRILCIDSAFNVKDPVSCRNCSRASKMKK